MQSVLYANISATDLSRLFGVGDTKIEQWKKAGCPCLADGTFMLPTVCRWLKKQHKKELARTRATSLFTQKDLAGLLGVTRQAITNWGRAGLPRRKDKLYNLSHVLGWLQCHYQACAKREYESRLQTMRKKVARNAAQLQRFLAGSEAV